MAMTATIEAKTEAPEAISSEEIDRWIGILNLPKDIGRVIARIDLGDDLEQEKFCVAMECAQDLDINKAGDRRAARERFLGAVRTMLNNQGFRLRERQVRRTELPKAAVWLDNSTNFDDIDALIDIEAELVGHFGPDAFDYLLNDIRARISVSRLSRRGKRMISHLRETQGEELA